MSMGVVISVCRWNCKWVGEVCLATYCRCVNCFFFHAEDGIRVAQESRGLVDVYKRQERKNYIIRKSSNFSKEAQIIAANIDKAIPVYYTHLTLPTHYSV